MPKYSDEHAALKRIWPVVVSGVLVAGCWLTPGDNTELVQPPMPMPSSLSDRPSQDGPNSSPASVEKWRPKDGTYAAPGKDFDDQCGEFGDVIIEFAEKAIRGNELNCKIEKLRDTAPDAIRLGLICDDYNLAESIGDPNPYDRKFKEIMLVKKIDGDTISVRKTLDGKFTVPAWRASYCPEEKQRLYREAKERDRAEKAQKAGR